MDRTYDALSIGYDKSDKGEVALVVCREEENGDDILYVVRTFNGEKAEKLYNALTADKEMSTMTYVDYVYDIVKKECEGMDSIYMDYIMKLVGSHGWNELATHNLVESCGVINGRPLYVLCDKK